MKHVFRIIGLAVIILTIQTLAQAQQTQLQNLTSAQFQTKLDQLVAQGYRPIKMWAKALQVIDYQPGETPRPGYWATFEKIPGTVAWEARFGLSGEAYQTEFNTLTGRGYMPTDINVTYVNGRISYCVIFDQIPNAKAWEARHGLNYATFLNINNNLILQGYTRRITSSCQTTNGPIYAAIWSK